MYEPFQINLCAKFEVGVKVPFVPYSYLVVPALLVEKTFFPPITPIELFIPSVKN